MVNLGDDTRISIESQAKRWLIRMDGDAPLTDMEKEALEEWMNRSAFHAGELTRLARLWSRANVMTELLATIGSQRRKPHTSEPDTIIAFISHVHFDDDMAQRLAKELERRGIYAVRTTGTITPGQPWTSELETAIAKCDLFFALISRKSSQSEWFTAAIALAISLAEQGRIRVIPVLADRDAEIPPLLTHVQPLEFFDSERAVRQLDALVLSIQNDAITGGDEAADRQAQLRYIKASKQALTSEIAAQKVRGASLSSSFEVTWRLIASLVVGVMLGGIAGFRGKASAEADLTSAYPGILALTFGLGVLVTALAFSLKAIIRRGQNPLRSRWERQ